MTPVYLPGKFHGQSSLAGYNLWGHRTVGHNSATCSIAQLYPTLCSPMNREAHQASLSLTISQNLPKFMSTASVMLSSHLILWHPLLFLPSILPSIRDFSNESTVHIRWTKYWSFTFSISPSNEYSGLISFRIDWFDLLAIQGSLRMSSVPQFEGINSLALHLLYGTALTSLHNYWKDHSLEYMDLCRQSDVSAF